MNPRILFCDPHQLFRESLIRLITNEPELTLVGHVGRAEDAFPLLDEQAVDVFVSEWSLPGTTALSMLEHVKQSAPSTSVLILTGHHGPDAAGQALASGAKGFALKQEPWSSVHDAILKVAGGG